MSTETDKSQLLDDDPDGQREWRALRGTVRHQTVGMIGEIFAILRILLQDAIILVVGFAVEFAFEHWLHSEQPFFKLAINISSAMFLLLYVVMVSVHVVHYVREQFGVTAANVTGNWIPWGLAGAAVIAAVVLYNMSAFRGNQPMNSAQPDMVRFNISAGEAISPDGRHIAYSATDSSGRIVIHIRSLDALDARPLSGTEVINAYRIFWSPDSRFIGFFGVGKVKKVDITTGAVSALADAPAGQGGTWSREGTIIFAPDQYGGLFSVPSSGGVAKPITTLDSSRQEMFHRVPQFLPDGQHYIYLIRSQVSENSGIYVGRLGSTDRRQLLQTEIQAAYVPPGYLLFIRERTLLAQPFDLQNFRLTGEPTPVAEDLDPSAGAGVGGFSASETDVLVHRTRNIGTRELIWFDRKGQKIGTAGRPSDYGFGPEISPDGTRVAIADGGSGSEDIWILDKDGVTPSRFTFNSARDFAGVWSPDGSRLIFKSNRGGGSYKLFQKTVGGTGLEEQLFDSGSTNFAPHDWSPDGRHLLFVTSGEKTGLDIGVMSMQGERKAIPYLQTPAIEKLAQFSPNGQWVAYTANESGGDEVFIQSFPTPGNKRQVSVGGGGSPRWRGDGRELFFIAADRKVMAVPIQVVPTLEIGAPIALFQTSISSTGAPGPNGPSYDVSQDGQRFLLNVETGQTAPGTVVVLNWLEKLKQKEPVQ